jgi:hypothetical protein
MNAVSTIDLNERGCFLLSQGRLSEGLEAFKKALAVLKREIYERSTDLLLSDTSQKSFHQEHEATARTTGQCISGLIPTPNASTREHERFWIFSRPLSMQVATEGSVLALCSNSDAFTISFNVALGSHLHGVEQAMEGDNDRASHSFMVAMKMYNLTLSQAKYKRSGVILNTLNDHLYAAIFNNLAHVHAMLGETSHSTVFAEQLLKTLFYLIGSGRVNTVQEATTHKLLLKNAHCLLMAPLNSAAAA